VFWGKKPDGKDHLENSNVKGRIILKWIFNMWDGEAWTESIWLRTVTGDGLF